MNHRDSYSARINRVVDHIDGHLAETLDLNTLASVAYLSPWHFHRVFHAMTGETLADRVRRRRLEVAATRLLARPPVPALRVALDAGFGSAEVFTRAFKAHFGVTPTAWRRGAFRQWSERHRVELSKIHQADRKANQAAVERFFENSEVWPLGRVPTVSGARMNVAIKTLPQARVAYMRHVGPYGSSGITLTWQRFADWCASQGFLRPRRRMYGITLDSPDVTPPERCRYDACVEVDASFTLEGEVGVQTIPAGRYACASFTGASTVIHDAWMRFFAEWLPDSNYMVDDRPIMELYDSDFSIDPETGAFACLLCMPIRSHVLHSSTAG
jgi:AraC family transcriptional regulator